MENHNRQVLGARRVLKNDQVGLDRPTGRKHRLASSGAKSRKMGPRSHPSDAKPDGDMNWSKTHGFDYHPQTRKRDNGSAKIFYIEDPKTRVGLSFLAKIFYIDLILTAWQATCKCDMKPKPT
jgi:hypothetical protein